MTLDLAHAPISPMGECFQLEEESRYSRPNGRAARAFGYVRSRLLLPTQRFRKLGRPIYLERSVPKVRSRGKTGLSEA